MFGGNTLRSLVGSDERTRSQCLSWVKDFQLEGKLLKINVKTGFKQALSSLLLLNKESVEWQLTEFGRRAAIDFADFLAEANQTQIFANPQSAEKK